MQKCRINNLISTVAVNIIAVVVIIIPVTHGGGVTL